MTEYKFKKGAILKDGHTMFLQDVSRDLQLIARYKNEADEKNAEIKRLKKTIHHMVACCGHPDCNTALRNIIAIGNGDDV